MRLVRPGGLIAGTRAGRPGRITAGAVATAASVLLLTGCHVPGTSTASAPPSSGTVTVAASPGIPDAPLYIAASDGLFRSAGLHVRLVSYPTFDAEAAALQQGKADIAFGGYGSLFYDQATGKHLDLKIVAEGFNSAAGVMEVLTLPSSGIVTPGELRGKTIGTAAPQDMPDLRNPGKGFTPFSLATMATTSVLSNDNVKTSTIRWLPMSEQDLADALGTKKVQAIVATEPVILQAEMKYGAVPVIDSFTGETANLPLDGYFSLGTFAAAHPAALAAFRSALEQAQTDATQPGSVQTVLHSRAGMKSETAALVTLGAYPTSVNYNDLARVLRLMHFYNMLPPGHPDLQHMLSP